jgi:hypothetical protein
MIRHVRPSAAPHWLAAMLLAFIVSTAPAFAADECVSPPPAPVGGSYPECSGGNVPSGTTCVLACAAGYTKTGADPTCFLGAYAGATNDCVPATCAPLSVPAGTTSDCGSAPTGSTCTVSCGAGYTGNLETATCTGTGPGASAWQFPPVTCAPNPCTVLPVPPSGGSYPGCTEPNVPSGTTCVLACAAGYTKTGADPQCYLGAFAGGTNDCVPATCAPLSNPTGTTSDCGSAQTGGTCTVGCGPGYTGDSETATCTGTGAGTSAWQFPAVSCVPNPCPLAPTPPIGGLYANCLSGTPVASGTTCELTCASGYTKTGTDPVCYLGAIVNLVPNDCVPADCAPLSGPGLVSDCATAPLGSSCTVSCDPGYTGGTRSAFCLGTGVGTAAWSDTGSCAPNPCGPPPAPPVGGSYFGCDGAVPSGTTCELTCASGYTKAGTDPQCVLGAFTGTGANDCVAATCAPLSGTGISSDCGSATTGSTCTASCSPGYTGGERTVSCVGTGIGTSAWQDPGSCAANACVAAPTAPTGGSYPGCAAGPIPSGTTCALTCADGYTKTGTDPQCTLGTLTGTGMNGCVPATCLPFSNPFDGVSCDAAPTGTTCTVTCEPGYVKLGDDPVCTGTGAGTSVWQGTASCVGCGPTPMTGCRQPTKSEKALLKLKDAPVDAKDQLEWKWASGAATALAEYGDPTTTESYHLCLYDAGTLRSSSHVPAGGTCGTKPCWKATKHAFQYKNKLALPDGVTQLQLKAGAHGKALIQLKGKGADLEMPVLGNALVGPVTVQLKRGHDTLCWEATYGAPFKKNDGTSFKDKSD